MIIYTTIYPLRMRAFPGVADDNIVGVVHPGTTLCATGGRAGDWRAVVGPCMDGVWRAGWCAFAYEGDPLLHPWGVTPCYASPVASRQPITQLFGENPDRYARWGYRGHNGLDLGTVPGTPALAISDGMIAHARFDPTGYGYYVRLDCVDGGIAVFAHLDRLLVYEGQRVQQGQMLGLTGNSGLSDAPHLHVDLRIPPVDDANGYGGRVDPLAYLDRRFLAWPDYLPAAWMPGGRGDALKTAKNDVLPNSHICATLITEAQGVAPPALSVDDLVRMERQLIPLLNTVRQMQGKRPVIVPGERRTGA